MTTPLPPDPDDEYDDTFEPEPVETVDRDDALTQMELTAPAF